MTDFIEIIKLFKKIYNMEKSIITDDGNHIYKQLKDLKFDLQINDFFEFEGMGAKALEIPNLTQAFYLPNDRL